MGTVEVAKLEPMNDEEVVRRVLAGETAAFEIIMRRYNQRLYRVARAILRDDSQAEDVVQDAYVRAYEHLAQFAGRAKFSTWLTRIAIHEALARARSSRRYQEPMSEEKGDRMDSFTSQVPDPEQQVSNLETRRLLEQSIEELPDGYREVFVLREVEELSTTETAEALEITEQNVKTRLHRARALLRRKIYSHVRMRNNQAFAFQASRCDRVVKSVFAMIQMPQGKDHRSWETVH